MSVQQNLDQIRSQLPDPVTLIAVSKTMPAETVHEAYEAGQRHFGENRVQELMQKQPVLPSDIQWHMIGHLQTNKVKYIIPYVYMIHSVDNLKLMRVIDREATGKDKVQNCLLELHIAEEASKFGFDYEELLNILRGDEWRTFKHIRWCGVMGMATFTEDTTRVREEFRKLKTIFNGLKSEFFGEDPSFTEISMGMSGDYPLAIEEGATMVRIGTKIFGSRH